MSLQVGSEDKTGLYMGTEIDGKWWKRYKNDGFFARGNGQYNYSEKAFYFYKYLAKEPIVIPLNSIIGFEIGKWHAGKWGAGLPVLKLIWEKDSLLLSSGFLLSKNRDGIERIITELKHLSSSAKSIL